jgi:hypothetical protein
MNWLIKKVPQAVVTGYCVSFQANPISLGGECERISPMSHSLLLGTEKVSRPTDRDPDARIRLLR